MQTGKPDWKNRPQELKLVKLKVVDLEESPRFPGRWMLTAFIDNAKEAAVLWMSFKQMTSVRRNADARPLYAVIDVADSERTRFVWASSDAAWLLENMINKKQGKADKAQDDVPVHFTQPVKPEPKKHVPVQPEFDEDSLF